MRMVSFFFRVLFLALFIYLLYYISFIQTEKYESQSTIMVKDLSKEQSSSPLGSLLMAGAGSESMTDAMLLAVYIKSSDMFNLLDKEFNLSAHYVSDEIDIVHRLSNSFLLPSYLVNYANLHRRYVSDLTITYDEPSTTIKISFSHANPKTAQEIVKRIIVHAGKTLNFFEKKNSEVVLTFLEKQEQTKNALFIKALKKLLTYQNRHHTIDPKIDIESKSAILAGLESELIQKKVHYNNKAQYLNKSTAQMKLLHGEIAILQTNIRDIKRKITGSKGKRKLNVSMSDFTLLKSEVEFEKEMYIQTLVKLEETRMLVNQNTKNLIIVSHAQVADSYAYPNKIKDSFSIFIILSFIYGILSLIFTIIRDHKD